MTDVKKVIALNRLRAQMLDEEVSPAQKQYYLELAQWLENQNIQTAEEATESIKNTLLRRGCSGKRAGWDPPQDTCGTRTGVRRRGEDPFAAT